MIVRRLLGIGCEAIIAVLWGPIYVCVAIAGALKFIHLKLVPDAPIPNGNVLHLEGPRVETLTQRMRGADYVRCSWCARDTVHIRREDRFVCVNSPQHADSFAYRQLAAGFTNAERYPGCICAPGEYTHKGRPDPECVGLAHRP